MRAAFVISTHGWAGVKTWCLDMARGLTQLGHDALISARPGEYLDACARHGIQTLPHAFGADFSPRSVAFYLKALGSLGVDRVVVNVAKDLRTAGVAARMLGIPICQHIGAVGDLRDTWRIRATVRLLRPHLVACSDYVRRGVLETLPFLDPGEITTLHPGTEPAAAPQNRVRRPRVIVSTSRLDPDKGHFDLLEALAGLKTRQGLDFRAIILGRGRLEEELWSRAAELGLDEIEWVGFTPNVRDHLQRGDVFVLPSLVEPLSIALEEALAQGLVPVARRVGGVPEIFPPGLSGLMFEPKTGAEGLAEKLALVLSASDEELAAWKREAWRHARDSFSLETQAGKFADLLARLEPGKSAA
jgi:glycosyltransferase involved in cell wall biosynthesis